MQTVRMLILFITLHLSHISRQQQILQPTSYVDLLVGLGVDPPAAVLGAGLDGLVARDEAEVGEVGARLALGGARRRGVEARPGVEDEGTGGEAGGGGGVGLLARPHLTLDL